MGKFKKIFFLIFFIWFIVFVYLKTEQIISEPENLWKNKELSSAVDGDSSVLNADCGVVLTGATGRLREGFELLAEKKIKKLIISGVYKEARMVELFPYTGYYPEVNLDDIFLEKRSETTFGNARHSLNLVEGLRCRDIILITSQVHMYRAFSVFKIVYPEGFSIKKLTLPNAKSESGLLGLCTEILKTVFYYVLSLVEYVSA